MPLEGFHRSGGDSALCVRACSRRKRRAAGWSGGHGSGRRFVSLAGDTRGLDSSTSWSRQQARPKGPGRPSTMYTDVSPERDAREQNIFLDKALGSVWGALSVPKAAAYVGAGVSDR